jgi:putative two-component system response regulator
MTPTETLATILAVDDDERGLAVVEAMLVPLGCAVVFAHSGEEAIEKAAEQPPHVILMDIAMPGMGGCEVVASMRANPETARTPIVMVSAYHDVGHRVQALECGADDFLSKPLEMAELQARVRTLVKVKLYHDHLHSYQKHLVSEINARIKDLHVAAGKTHDASMEVIVRLAAAAEYKDEDTGAHIRRIGRYAAALSRRLRLPSAQVELIQSAAQMHDIGKLGIPDQILQKPGPLDPGEWIIMRQHSAIGADILRGSALDVIQMAERIALTHHERWDGNGYPRGLVAAEIPIEGRIVAVIDVFDALTSWRPYRKEPAYSPARALSMMREGRGTHFDPAVFDAFLAIWDEILDIKKEYVDA